MKILFLFLCTVPVTSIVEAATVSTSFARTDGFFSGAVDDATIGIDFQITFRGGRQEQSFDGPAYAAGPEAYFFVNGQFTGSFGGTISGSTDVGSAVFSTPVDLVSFFAADRANGTPGLRVIGSNGVDVLATQSITQTVNRGGTPLSFSSASLGDRISRIEFDNAGPAGNPPYVIAIDSFSATINAVPEPSSVTMLSVAGCGMLTLRRRRR